MDLDSLAEEEEEEDPRRQRHAPAVPEALAKWAKWVKWKWTAAAKRAGEFGDPAATAETRVRETRVQETRAPRPRDPRPRDPRPRDPRPSGSGQVGESKKGEEETVDNQARSSPVRAQKFKTKKGRRRTQFGGKRGEGGHTLPFFQERENFMKYFLDNIYVMNCAIFYFHLPSSFCKNCQKQYGFHSAEKARKCYLIH